MISAVSFLYLYFEQFDLFLFDFLHAIKLFYVYFFLIRIYELYPTSSYFL